MPKAGKKSGGPTKSDILTDGNKEVLPQRKALTKLAKGPKSINDYSKAGTPINGYPTATDQG